MQESNYNKLYQENSNLQEALVRESKSGTPPKTKASTGTNKPPALVGGISKKESLLDKEPSKGISASIESLDLLNNKCKSLEELIVKKDQENLELQKKIQDLEAH